MFKTILAVASFALLAIASGSPAHAGRMSGSGGVNGLGQSNGMTSANGAGLFNGLNGMNGLSSENGTAPTGVGAEGFQIHTLEIERPAPAR